MSIENLYIYDAAGPITEDAPLAPASRKGVLRQKMADGVMALHARGEIRATALRSSDYYGPVVVTSALGSSAPRRASVVSPLMMRLVRLFVPAARASVEMMYAFTAPFVVDSTRIERAFDLTATPIATGTERTLAWFAVSTNA